MFHSCAETEIGQYLSFRMGKSESPSAWVSIATRTNVQENSIPRSDVPEFIDIFESKGLQFVHDEDKVDGETPIQIYVGPESDIPNILLLENIEYEIKVVLLDESAAVFPYLRNTESMECRKSMYSSTTKDELFFLKFESYVGKGFFDIETKNHEIIAIPFEVRSKKMGYRKDYTKMLEDIAEYSALLLLNPKAPLHTSFDLSEQREEVLYERFLILEYLFKDDRFPEAYEYFRENIKAEVEVEQDIEVSALAMATDQLDLVELINVNNLSHCVGGVIRKTYAPLKVKLNNLINTIDSSENRVIKDLFLTLSRIVEDLETSTIAEDSSVISYKLKRIRSKISEYQEDEWMDEVGDLVSVPYNSSTLQMRHGYAELFEMYLILFTGIKLNDSRDLLEGHNKRMSKMYEYWACLQLFDCLRDMSSNAPEIMLEKEDGGFSIKNICSSPFTISVADMDTEFEVRLFYNRGFPSKSTSDFDMLFRPDYTLVIRPKALLENSEFIIHFDAKYKSRVLEKDPNQYRTFKSEDLHKMHTYQNAINRSWGSYILYPGDKDEILFEKYEHSEKLPGIPSVGAISLIPGDSNQNLKSLLEKVFKSIAEVASTVKEGDWYLELNVFVEK